MSREGIGRAQQAAAGRLLRGIVRLLRPGQAEWGEAMRAELTALPPGRLQWGFVLGCAGAVLSLRAGLATAAWFLLRAAAVIGTFALAARIPGTAIRLAAMTTLAVLLAAYALLRSSAGFGPTAGNRPVRIVAVCGLVVLAVEPVLEMNDLRLAPPGGLAGPPDTGHAVTLLVLLAVVVLAYLTALSQVTARRSDVAAATVATGATLAAASAATWLTVVVLRPALGAWNGPALTAILAAGLVAATVTAHRTAPRHGPSGGEPGLIAGLLACAGTSLIVGTLIDLLPVTGIFVSTSAPPDHSGHPQTHLVDSVGVWFIGLTAAVALGVTIRRQGRIGAGTSAGEHLAAARVRA
jgi:hypothetical protein